MLDARNTAWAGYLLGEYIQAHGEEAGAWYASLEADPEGARALGEHLAREAFLQVSVLQDGAWRPQGMAWEVGPEIAKRQVIPLDLTGIEGPEVEIRLDAPASFRLVDHVGMAWVDATAYDFTVERLRPEVATAADGTDLRRALAEMDGLEVVMETGDEFELEFRAPPVPAEMERSYLLDSGGWYQIDSLDRGEADVRTLQRVETEPGAVARIAAERMNEALEILTSSAMASR